MGFHADTYFRRRQRAHISDDVRQDGEVELRWDTRNENLETSLIPKIEAVGSAIPFASPGHFVETENCHVRHILPRPSGTYLLDAGT